MNRTPEQVAINKAAYETNESLLIEALAGTGKTTSLLDVLKILRQPSAIVLAFNKRIANEMARRMPPIPRNRIVHVKTLHSAGYWITRHHFPNLEVSGEISEQRIRNAAGNGAPLRVLGAATKLLRMAKDFQHAEKLDLDFAWQLGFQFECFGKLQGNAEVQRAIEITARAYRASLIVDKVIDFPDQGWLPLVLGLDPPWRYKAVLVDEAQDVNPNQLAMVERMLAPGGRIIAAGDRNQAIYEWRGATSDEVWETLKEKYKARCLSLTTTWRCDLAIVKEAQRIVPDLKARPGAGPGAINLTTEKQFLADMAQANSVVAEWTNEPTTTFVLSRTNAELFRIALEMWKDKIAFNIAQTEEVLTPIKNVLTRVLRGGAQSEPKVSLTRGLSEDAIEEALSLFHHRRQRGEARAAAMRRATEAESRSIESFKQQLGAWYMTEMMKASASGSTSNAEKIDDQYKTILYCLNYVRDPREIEPLLEQIFLYDETCWITLSTAHKAKGLEADYVYLLRDTFAAYQNRVDRDGACIPIPREELRIEYVAITRAKRELTWVILEGNE